MYFNQLVNQYKGSPYTALANAPHPDIKGIGYGLAEHKTDQPVYSYQHGNRGTIHPKPLTSKDSSDLSEDVTHEIDASKGNTPADICACQHTHLSPQKEVIKKTVKVDFTSPDTKRMQRYTANTFITRMKVSPESHGTVHLESRIEGANMTPNKKPDNLELSKAIKHDIKVKAGYAGYSTLLTSNSEQLPDELCKNQLELDCAQNHPVHTVSDVSLAFDTGQHSSLENINLLEQFKTRYRNPTEEDLQTLVALRETIGGDHANAKADLHPRLILEPAVSR